MKKWGFKGQPATHGQTKTHRRPGSLSSGRRKGLWRGKKLPGWMGNKWRVARGLKIWRINTETNTMWVSGIGIPGNPNDYVYIFDTLLPHKHPKEPYPMPTFLGDDSQLPEDIYDEEVHKFNDPTIFYEPEK
jgi:large subunit ribosomal protein L3